jgi:hypothetical protein
VLSNPAAVADVVRKEEEDSDGEGSDFEIPPLVMKTDFSDEDDEEDE